MDDITAVNLGMLAFRVAVGVVMFAHGYRHIFGGGKIAGTAGWFESLGMKPGVLHAWVASVTEIVAGVGLVLGLATPLCAAGVIGTMTVAWVTNHWRNGFFIFNKGEGYEYVMTLVLSSFGLAAVGAGEWSLDNALGWWGDADGLKMFGSTGLYLAGLGLVAAAGLLAVFWRRPAPSEG